MGRFLRRFRQLVVVAALASGVAIGATLIRWPRHFDAFAARWSDHVEVSVGVAAIVLALVVLLVLALMLELRQARRDLDRVRRGLAELNGFSYRPAPWGSRAFR